MSLVLGSFRLENSKRDKFNSLIGWGNIHKVYNNIIDLILKHVEKDRDIVQAMLLIGHFELILPFLYIRRNKETKDILEISPYRLLPGGEEEEVLRYTLHRKGDKICLEL